MPQSDDRRIRRILERIVPDEAARAVIQVIPVEQFEHNPWTEPIRLDSESMSQLTDETFTYGLREPLLARRLPNDRYEVILGGPRLEAARRTGHRTAQAVVADLSDETAAAIALADAFTRERLTPWEMAQGLAEFLERLGELGQDMDAERIAALLDHTPEWVQRLQYLADRLPPAVLEQAGLSVHDMNELSEDALLRAAEPAAAADRAQRLRAFHAARGNEYRGMM